MISFGSGEEAFAVLDVVGCCIVSCGRGFYLKTFYFSQNVLYLAAST